MSIRSTRALLLSLALVSVPGLFYSHEALAQDYCPAPYTHEQWRAEMDKVDAAYATIDLDGARRLIEGMWQGVGCLDRVAKPGHLARFARQKALLAFYDQDEDTAVRWGLLSREAAADFPWPAEMTEDHPFRSMVMAADAPPIGGPEGSGLLIVKKGSYFIDGQPMLEPKARAEIPNLVQQADKKGTILSTFWQDGAAFPADLLGPLGEKPVAPKWFVPTTSYADAGGPADVVAALTPETKPPETKPPETKPPETKPPETKPPETKPPETKPPETKPPETKPPETKPPETKPPETKPPETKPPETKPPETKPPETKPPETKPPETDPLVEKDPKPKKKPKIKFVNLAIGGGLGLGAGALWLASRSTSAKFEQTTTYDEMVSTRTANNWLVVSAGVLGAGAIGVGVTAFVSDDGPGFGIHGHW